MRNQFLKILMSLLLMMTSLTAISQNIAVYDTIFILERPVPTKKLDSAIKHAVDSIFEIQYDSITEKTDSLLATIQPPIIVNSNIYNIPLILTMLFGAMLLFTIIIGNMKTSSFIKNHNHEPPLVEYIKFYEKHNLLYMVMLITSATLLCITVNFTLMFLDKIPIINKFNF